MAVNIGSRIERARKAGLLSRSELAARLGISIGQLTKFEQGKEIPPHAMIFEIARATGFKPNYFRKQSVVKIENIKLNNQSTISQREYNSIFEQTLEQAERHFEIFALFPWTMPKPFQRSEVSRNLRKKSDLVEIAQQERFRWDAFSDDGELIPFLESLGILVFTIKKTTAKFCGMTANINGFPAIAVGAGVHPPGRQQECLAHEFGHIVLGGRIADPRAEEEASDIFASEFLKDKCFSRDESSQAMECAVISAYDRDELSDSKAAELLGISIFDFAELNRMFERE